MRLIVIEAETPGDSRTMFRIRIDKEAIGEGQTAVQTHILVGAILDRIALPKSAKKFTPLDAADTQVTISVPGRIHPTAPGLRVNLSKGGASRLDRARSL